MRSSSPLFVVALAVGACSPTDGSPGAAPLRIDVGAVDCAGGTGAPTDEVEDEELEGEDERGSGACAAPGWVGDGPYDVARGFGWVGAPYVEVTPEWAVQVFPIATGRAANPGTDLGAYLADVFPHRTSAAELKGYQVDLPNGAWTVTAHLLEPSFPDGGLRSYDLHLEDVTLPGLDLGEQAGQGRVVSLSALVEVTDGSLDVRFEGGGGVLTALEVVPGRVSASAPSGLEVRAGAGENLVRWEVPDQPVRGWLVERSVGGGDWQVASGAPVVVPSFVDRSVTVGDEVAYRVSVLAADGLPSGASTSPSVTSRTAESFGLPVLDLHVEPADLLRLYGGGGESGEGEGQDGELQVPVRVVEADDEETGTIELRGQSTRGLPKRSYNVDLDSGRIDSRRKLKLLAEAPDPSRLQQALTYDLLERMGTVSSHARQVIVRLNGEVLGVYDDIEAVGDDFLEDRGYTVDDRWRILYTDLSLQIDDTGAIDLSGFEKKENESDPSPELEDLLVWLDSAGDHEVAEQLEDCFDPEVLADYLAGQILIANPEAVDGGHYLVLDPATGGFLLVPWDHNNGTWSRSSQALHEYTAWSGWDYRHWTRAFTDPGFRGQLADRLETALAGSFSASEQHAAIDRIAAAQQPALQVEPYLFERRLDAWQASLLPSLHAFVDERRSFVAAQLPALRVLGEADLTTVFVDPDGGRVEVENLASEPVASTGCSVVADGGGEGVLTGSVAPGERVSVAVALPGDGGRIRVVCGASEEPGEERRDEHEGAGSGLRSLVHVPALPPGATYMRGVDGWSVMP